MTMRIFGPLRALLGRPAPPAGAAPAPVRRVLFLDDDPLRAATFLAEKPQAVWVQTAAECIARLAEPWDEVHLDHDLGGEHFVDLSRDDCGMAVVRWVCLEPRPHLRPTRFQVHSHNPQAATIMGMQLMGSGFSVELRPFGAPPLPPLPEVPPVGRLAGLFWRLRRLFRTASGADAHDPHDRAGGRDADDATPEGLDLSWTKGSFRRDTSAGHEHGPGSLDLSWAAGAQPPPHRDHPAPHEPPEGAGSPPA
jgi:hypothetical protein